MISKKLFEKIKSNYGDVASWAVWEDAGLTPKSNMGHLNIFDIQKKPSLLKILKTDVVMVGLNFSRPVIPTEPFKNFHDLNPSANDFKIRYAFRDTEFYGAYMTDIIKNLEIKNSNDVKSLLKNDPDLVQENVSLFRQELSLIEANNPLILAFGAETYRLLKKHLREVEYSKLVQLTHYSHFISKENFKKNVAEQISEALGKPERDSKLTTIDKPTTYAFVKQIMTWDSGGGMAMDIVELDDGQILRITEGSVVLYKDKEDLELDEVTDRPMLFL